VPEIRHLPTLRTFINFIYLLTYLLTITTEIQNECQSAILSRTNPKI